METTASKILVVGDPECEFHDILQALMNSPVKNQLTSRYKEFARQLCYPEHKLSELSKCYTMGTSTIEDILVEILTWWRSKNAQKATLHQLVDLIRNDFTEFAYLLEAKFLGVEHLEQNVVKQETPISEQTSLNMSLIPCHTYQLKKGNIKHIVGSNLMPSPLNTILYDQTDYPDITGTRVREPSVSDPLMVSPSKGSKGFKKDSSTNQQNKSVRQNIFIFNRTEYSPSPKILFRLKCIMSLLVIMAIFALLIFMQTGHSQRTDGFTANNSNEKNVVSLSASTQSPFANRNILSTMTELDLEQINITVTNYKEYYQLLQKVAHPLKIHLTITISSVSEWPPDGNILYPEYISQLYVSGPLHLRVVFDFLESSSILQALILNNNNNGLCDLAFDFRQYAGVHTVFLSRLEYIRLEKFSSCANLYSSIVHMFKLNNLKTFELIESVIDDNNLDSLSRMLRQPENLTKMEFSVTSTIGKRITYILTKETFQNLKDLKFDINYFNLTEDRQFVFSFEFKITQCRLERLVSKNGIVSYSDIFYCKYLKTLDIAVDLPETDAFNDISLFSKKLPLLQDLRIILCFGRCPAKALLGWNKLEECISSFYVKSGCVIKYPQSVEVSSYPTSDEKFVRKNYC